MAADAGDDVRAAGRGLLLARVPVADYKVGGDLVSFFLGPATIALGVSLYEQAARLRQHAAAVLVAVTAGAAATIGAAAAAVWVAGGSGVVFRSMLPKGVTTPIAIELARQVGGAPELSAAFAVLGGLFGSVVGPGLLRARGVRGDLAAGLAMGTSSHGIGNARAVRDGESASGAAGLAMARCGIVTSVVLALLAGWLKS